MEPEIRALAAAPRVWSRGGGREIAWTEDAWELKMDPEILVNLDGFWTCTTTDGARGGVRVDDVDLDTFELESVGDHYNPVLEEPEMYLAFAALGRAAWDSLGGRYLTEYGETQVEGRGYLNDDVLKKVKDFHETYGPPYMWEEHRGLHQTMLTDMLHDAQLVDVLVQYQRVITREATNARLRKQMIEIVDSERESALSTTMSWHRDRRNEIVRSYPQARLTMTEWRRLVIAELESEGLQFKESLYGTLDLTRDADLIRSVEIMLHNNQGRAEVVGGLDIYVENAAAPDSDDGGWRFMFSYYHLTNVVWYQAFQALIRQSLIRNCRNDQCPRPDGFFTADRPNQFYCSITCRNYHNTRRHREKLSRGNLHDSLP